MNNIAGGRSAEEIRITGAGSELQGVGRLSDGRAVFVPGALPGETVRAEIVRAAKRYCEARLVEVLDPSPERRAPDCPHYGVCGGCQGRHMTYAETLRLKRGRVRDALVRIGGLDSPEVFPVIGCDSPDRTRNKAEFPIGRDAGGRIAIGAHMAGSRTVVPLDDCLLQKPAAVRAMRWLSERLDGLGCARHLTNLVTRVNRRGEMMAVLCADAPVESAVRALVPEMVRTLPELRSLYFLLQNRRPSHALDGRCMHLWGQRALDDELMGLTFSLSPQSFFQVNAEQAERLYEVALAAVGLGAENARVSHQPEAGCAAPRTGSEMGDSCLPAGQTPARDVEVRVLDAYCGVGTIALAAARRACDVLGVEIVAPAVADAVQNARRNGMDGHARFVCADAASEIPRRIARGERFDAVILDPPRKGADEKLLRALLLAAPPRIAYVSCDPATLARDVRILCEGGYHFEWAQPVDMFPWTGHVETVVLLSHKKPDSTISVKVEFGEGEGKVPLDNIAKRAEAYKPKERVTYKMIKEYIEAKYGFKVHTAYIAEVKRSLGLPMYDAPNAVEELKQPRKHPTAEKVEAIKDALKHFEVI